MGTFSSVPRQPHRVDLPDLAALRAHVPGRLLGLTGAPGAGKSTLAARMAAEWDAVVVPMDGFHCADVELRRRGRSLAYVTTRSGYEVDLLAEDPRGSRELIQVSASLEDPATRQRELRALEEGMRETSCERATLVTLREEGAADLAGHTVRIVPAWRWLLEPEAAA